MTTSDSSFSDKKMYVECISSEVYLTVRPESKNILEEITKKYNKWISLDTYVGNQIFKYSCGTSYGMHSCFCGNIREGLNKKYGVLVTYMPAYLAIKISYREVLDLLNRANELILETEEGIRSAINKIIDTDTKRGIQPGTLRLFSNDLICYYTGKNWKKIERRS